MDGFKEFQGKDLDSAIAEACGYFDTPRERLEIEIVQDAKSGIFGIVGARKAKVRARRAQLREAVESVLGPRGGQRADASPHEDGAGAERRARREPPQEGESRAAPRKPRAGRRPARADARTPDQEAPTPPAALPATTPPAEAKPAGERPAETATATPAAGGNRRAGGRPRSAPQAAPAAATEREHAPAASPAPAPGLQHAHELDADDAPEGLPRTPLEELDPQRLQRLTEETVKELVRPITGGQVPVSVRVEDGRVRANVDWSGDAGLLIGREGQTLAALQYLASRMVSHGMDAAVRVQLDIGDYRLRQDEKLRSLALSLAEKARATGRAYSTRPLSSYHRRIIHLCLQDAEDLQTRSSGDGPLKRVIIARRKPEDA